MAISTVVVTVNGIDYTLTYNSTSGRYEKTITAPSATSGSNNAGSGPGVGAAASGLGYYPVSVAATNDFGTSTTVNSTDATFGAYLRLKVLETVVPVITVSGVTQGATVVTNTPAIAVTVTDAGSGVNPAAVSLSLDGGTYAAVTVSGSGTSYSGTYTPSAALTDGSHTVQVKAIDWDGNEGSSSLITFTVDTTPPELSVSYPTDQLKTNATPLTLVGTTSDATSSPVTISITLGGTDVGTVTVNADGTFSRSIPIVLGTNTIIVTATDGAGKTSTLTRTVYYDDSKPVFGVISITPNPTDTGMMYTIAVTVTDQ